MKTRALVRFVQPTAKCLSKFSFCLHVKFTRRASCASCSIAASAISPWFPGWSAVLSVLALGPCGKSTPLAVAYGRILPILVLTSHALVFTPPEVANTGPGVNRGSGGGARGCGFEERVGVHARSGGVHFL